MNFRDFVSNVRLLTLPKLLIATLIAWVSGLPFAGLFSTIAPNVVTGGPMVPGKEVLSALSAVVVLVISVLFLKGMIGKHNKKNGFYMGILFGVFFGALNALSMLYMAHSYLYLFFLMLVPSISFGFTGYYLGEKRAIRN